MASTLVLATKFSAAMLGFKAICICFEGLGTQLGSRIREPALISSNELKNVWTIIFICFLSGSNWFSGKDRSRPVALILAAPYKTRMPRPPSLGWDQSSDVAGRSWAILTGTVVENHCSKPSGTSGQWDWLRKRVWCLRANYNHFTPQREPDQYWGIEENENML